MVFDKPAEHLNFSTLIVNVSILACTSMSLCAHFAAGMSPKTRSKVFLYFPLLEVSGVLFNKFSVRCLK